MKRLLLIVAFLFVASSASAQCPSIVVKGPQGLTTQGDTMTFSAQVAVAGPRLAYRWSVSAGTIEQGQGTAEIIVRTDSSLAGTTLTATVEVDGLPSACEKTASESAPVAPGCGLALVDDWSGSLKPNDVRARLDSFLIDLSNNPTHIGVVLLVVTQSERQDKGNKRIQLILKHIAYRKFNLERIWFQFETGDEIRTKIYRLPAGELICEKCHTIKGADIQ